ncbi:hypothetical protein GCM10027030_05230 [Luteococcus sediminum]
MRITRTAATGVGVALAVALAGCSGASDATGTDGGSGDTWQGKSLPYQGTGQDFYVGQWNGQPGQVTVICAGDPSAPTVTLASPKGDKAVIQPGSGGKGATVTVTSSDGTEATGESDEVSATSGEMEFLSTPDPIDVAGMRLNGKFTCQTP